ncbi:MAG: 2,3-bisphosphoglycerate-independent phosphoglycerate mutase [Acidobacteriota bacterium]
MPNRPIVLVILDGWGVSSAAQGNAVSHASTPYFDELCSRYPSTELSASGASVGLPDGVAAGSEIGHMNIGAGRVVRTDAARISEAIAGGEFFENEILKTAFANAANGRVHLIGLLSDGDVHSSPETLYALLRMAKRMGVKNAFVHGILDGRDVPPRTADIYVEALEIKMADIGLGKIASLCGRFLAMDSDNNWERTARVFTMLTLADGERSFDALTAVRSSFLRGISDEFIAPIVIEQAPDVPVATISDGDLVIFFNHRADGMRQLVRSLTVPDAASSAAKPVIDAVCLTAYDAGRDLTVAFPADAGGRTVASMLDDRQINNYRITDGDRFAHVTNFFNGATDAIGAYEFRVKLPAASSADRESEPELTSFKTTDKALRAIESDPNGVFIINLPAAALVAETGDFARTVEAVQYVDTCLGGIVEKVRDAGGVAIVTSSHANCVAGNGERTTIDPDAKLPFHLVDEGSRYLKLRSGGSLQDVGSTLLALAGIEIPDEMTGRDLRIT